MADMKLGVNGFLVLISWSFYVLQHYNIIMLWLHTPLMLCLPCSFSCVSISASDEAQVGHLAIQNYPIAQEESVPRCRWRSELTQRAHKDAIEVFARNVRSLLLTPPLQTKGHVLALDPGFSHGCNVLQTGVLYLHSGTKREEEYARLKHLLLDDPLISLIGIGDGVGSRETELLVSQLLMSNVSHESSSKRRKLDQTNSVKTDHVSPKFVSVSEKGVSVWSVSPSAEKEFPKLSPNFRSAISLGRRLLDPLGELTKVEPRSLGVGMYQHDLPAKTLDHTLHEVTEECVSLVGLDVNIAPEHLLAKVAGLGPVKAAAIAAYREKRGTFKSRTELLEVKGIGPRCFQQCAGFLRIRYFRATPETTSSRSMSAEDVEMKSGSSNNSSIARQKRKAPSCHDNKSATTTNVSGVNPLDSTWIHPEQFSTAMWILNAVGVSLKDFGTEPFRSSVGQWFSRMEKTEGIEAVLKGTGSDLMTLKLIVSGLSSPEGFVDIRDHMSTPLLRSHVLTINDLKPGEQLQGRVSNITPFGAFVDIGIGKDGLIHRSKCLSAAGDSLAPGMSVSVSVIAVDTRRERVQLAQLPHTGQV